MGTTIYAAARPLRLGRLRAAFASLLLLSLLPLAAVNAAGVVIQVDGRTIPFTQSAATVREALDAENVALAEQDEVVPPLDAPVPQSGTIRVLRITYVEDEAEVAVPYRTVIRPATGKRRPYHPTVVRAGRSGLKRVTYRAKLVDGAEASRETLTEEAISEPVHQIVVSRRPSALGSRGVYAGKRTMTMVATAYDPGPGSCGKYADGKTCNGKRAGYGIVAVDPKVIPLGTKLFVPGYGYGIAADVGGAIKGNRIDLGYNSRSGALKWGKKQVQVRIVE